MSGAKAPISTDVSVLLGGCTASCQLLAEQEEGPYRRSDQPRRRDLAEGRPGVELRLGVRLRTAAGDPVVGADIDVWHCDAEGRYSGYPPNDPGVDMDPSPQDATYLPDETFLRGRQTTDASGDVEFHTIFPGWYPGRAVHVHVMVHAQGRASISQLYLPEALTERVFAQPPYRAHGLPDTTHATDGIFATGGQPAVLETHAGGSGIVAAICLVLPNQESS